MNDASCPDAPATPPAAIDEQTIRAALRRVVDPEIGKNIVALGLIYRIDSTPERLLIEMTMTSPACPMGDMIIDDALAELARILPPTITPDIQLVWNPPWDPSMMDEASKADFGWTPSQDS